MAPRRRTLAVGFAVALLLGVGIYFRLWTIDSQDNADFADEDREALRRQFERANLEAMDESAEWRMKYDGEVERNRRLEEELLKVKTSLASATRRSNLLQQENASLQNQMKFLKQQTEAYGQQCNCSQASSKP